MKLGQYLKNVVFLSRFASAVVSFCARLVSAIALLGSICIAVAAVAGSFLVPTKVLGVPVAAVGCFVAGWIFGVFLRIVAKKGSSDRDNDEMLKKNRSEIAKLENENSSLRMETERLASQRIDINAFRSILKLGLAQADMVIKDVKVEWMDDFDGGIVINPFSKATRSQYVGVLQHSFKAICGVDLEKLRVCEFADAIYVVGIAPESLGFKDYRPRWILRQAHKYKLVCKQSTGFDDVSKTELDSLTEFHNKDGKIYAIDRSAPFEGTVDLNSIERYSRRQEEELGNRVNNVTGAEFECINKYILEMAKGFVKILLSPIGKDVKFDDKMTLAEIKGKDRWISLEEFARNYNKSIGMSSTARSLMEEQRNAL